MAHYLCILGLGLYLFHAEEVMKLFGNFLIEKLMTQDEYLLKILLAASKKAVSH